MLGSVERQLIDDIKAKLQKGAYQRNYLCFNVNNYTVDVWSPFDTLCSTTLQEYSGLILNACTHIEDTIEGFNNDLISLDYQNTLISILCSILYTGYYKLQGHNQDLEEVGPAPPSVDFASIGDDTLKKAGLLIIKGVSTPKYVAR